MILYLVDICTACLPVACVEEMTSSLTNEAMTHILLHAVLMADFDKKVSINNQNKCFQNFKTLTLRWFSYRVTHNCLDWAKYQNRHFKKYMSDHAGIFAKMILQLEDDFG